MFISIISLWCLVTAQHQETLQKVQKNTFVNLPLLGVGFFFGWGVIDELHDDYVNVMLLSFIAAWKFTSVKNRIFALAHISIVLNIVMLLIKKTFLNVVHQCRSPRDCSARFCSYVPQPPFSKSCSRRSILLKVIFCLLHV